MPTTQNVTHNPPDHVALAALPLQYIALQALALHFTIMAYAYFSFVSLRGALRRADCRFQS